MSQLWRTMYGIDEGLAIRHAEEDAEEGESQDIFEGDNIALLVMTEDEINALTDLAETVEHSDELKDISFDDLCDKAFEHHGILGMKWGVRRFQNEDGSLTVKGKQRYYDLTKVGDATKFAAKTRTGVRVGAGVAGTAALATSRLAQKAKFWKNEIKTANEIWRNQPDKYQLFNRLSGTNAYQRDQYFTNFKAAAIAAGIVGLLGGAYAISKYIKNKKDISSNYGDPDAVSNMKSGMKKRKAETGSLAKAIDDKNYGTVFRNWLYNKKMSKDMKSTLASFDAKLKAAVQKVNDPSTSKKESSRIKMDTASGMKQYATQILKEMGWSVNDQNIYYLTQVIWKFGQ